VYRRRADLAADSGIIVADTKIELGFDETGTLRLADEALTLDSSRFWPAESLAARPSPGLVRQVVRAGLAQRPGLRLGPARRRPAAASGRIVDRRQTYETANECITGMRWR
jgi:phosphoribosylaminoimidazole-succinocarboxamide synthase